LAFQAALEAESANAWSVASISLAMIAARRTIPTFRPRRLRLRFVRNLSQMDEFPWARLPPKSVRREEKLAGEPPLEATSGYRTMIDQGLRLHRAFRTIRSAALREAIVTFVVELEKGENAN
jgi:hypothetical protein